MRGRKNHIYTFIRKNIKYLVFSVIFASIGVTLMLFVPILTGKAIDFIIDENNVDFGSVARILIVLAVTVSVSSVFQWLMALFTNKLSYKTVNNIRKAVFDKFMNVPLRYIDSNSQGDFLSRMITDTDQISEGLLQGFTQLISGIITIIGTLIFMMSINVSIAIAVVFITPVSLLVAAFIAKRTHKMFTEQSKIRGDMSGYVEEIIGNQKVVKAFGREKVCEKYFADINSNLYDVGVKAMFASSLTNPSTRFINGLVYATVGVFGAMTIIGGVGFLSVGQIASFLSYANQYTKPFNEISGVITELQAAFASMNRVSDVLEQENEPDDSMLESPEKSSGDVELRNVWFSYSKDRKLIQNLNLKVKSGQKIAIVGPTGCGKTTLINLLMRFYDVDSGHITVSGSDIQNITRKSLRSFYGMVLQDTWLFTGTVRDNLKYGNPHATEEEIEQAAKNAYAHSFITRLPNGYDTIIDESGSNISQGQKQLLCIARVMLTNPSMLILDEATSSIDTLTEKRIQMSFQKMMQGKTSFIVAHRLSTICESDIILVMKDGNVIEQGNHNELIEKKGFYYDLYNSQFKES